MERLKWWCFPVWKFDMQKTRSATERLVSPRLNLHSKAGHQQHRKQLSCQKTALLPDKPVAWSIGISGGSSCPQRGCGSPMTKYVFYFSSPFLLHHYWSKPSTFSTSLSNPLLHFYPEIKKKLWKKSRKYKTNETNACHSWLLSLLLQHLSQNQLRPRAVSCEKGWAVRRRLPPPPFLVGWGCHGQRLRWNELLSRRKIREDKGRTRIKSPWKMKTLISSFSVLHPLESVLQWKITTILNTIS